MEHTTSDTAALGLGLAIICGLIVFGLALYLFSCFCLKRICQKCGKEPGILIWIPIVHLIPLLEVAGMALWMILLLLIPIVNLIVMVMLWVKICEKRGKSPWLVIMMFVPGVNLFFIPYLAFSE